MIMMRREQLFEIFNHKLLVLFQFFTDKHMKNVFDFAE